MKGIKSFCNHLKRPCAFALHSPPTKILILVSDCMTSKVTFRLIIFLEMGQSMQNLRLLKKTSNSSKY